MEKFIMAAHTALRIRDTQHGVPTLVLLHGYLESLDTWDELTRYLSPPLRVIALDLPGHGISEVKGEVHTMEFLSDVVCGVLDREGVERCFVAGHSMGGYVAQAFAERHSDRLEGLILLHATPNTDTDERRAQRLREMELIRSGKKDLIGQLFAPNGFAPANRNRLNETIEQMQAQIALTDDDGITALLGGLIARKNQNEMLRGLDRPQLFIFGREDPMIDPARAEAVGAAHPQAQIAWLEHSGHMGHLEEPEQTAQIMRSFIEACTNE